MKQSFRFVLALLSVFLALPTARAADVGQLIVKAVDAETYSASWTNFELDHANDQMEYFFQCEEACAISALCARQGAVDGTPPTYEFRLEGVTSGARADGTVKGAANAGKGDITLPGANTTFCTTLGATYTCTKGEFLSGVIDYRTGTISGSASAHFTYQNGAGLGTSFPSTVTVDSGAGTRRNGLSIPFGYKCGSTFYGNNIQSFAIEDFGTGSNPDERGNEFSVPAGACDTFKIDGARFYGYLATAAGSGTYVIYEGTTVRQTATVDSDYSNGNNTYVDVKWSEGYTFTCGTTYQIIYKAVGAGGTSHGIAALTYANAGEMNSLPLGTSMYYTGRQDAAGSWTNTTTKRAAIDLVISDITEPSGGGGGKTSALNGGFN